MDKNTINELDQIKNQITEATDLSLTLNDSSIYRLQKNPEHKHLLTLTDLLAYKLKLIEDDYEYLISRLK